MPRRKPRVSGGRNEFPLRPFGDALRRIESGLGGHHVDGSYVVRPVPGARATKTHRCPGCDHEIAPAVAHVVVWPADDFGGAEERRHWHTGCWNGRSTRGLTRRWS